MVHAAANSGSTKILKILFKYPDALNVPRKPNLQSPVHLAKTKLVAEALLDFGFEVDEIDGDGCTPLHRAADRGQGDVMEVLLQHGANMNMRDHRNNSPLDYCARPKTQRVLAHRYMRPEGTNGLGIKSVNFSQVKITLPTLVQLAAASVWKATPRGIKAPQWLSKLPADLKTKIEGQFKSICSHCGDVCFPRFSFLATYSLIYPSRYPNPRLVTFNFRRPEILCNRNSCYETQYWNRLYRRVVRTADVLDIEFRCSDTTLDANGEVVTDEGYFTNAANGNGNGNFQGENDNDDWDDYGSLIEPTHAIKEEVDTLEAKAAILLKWKEIVGLQRETLQFVNEVVNEEPIAPVENIDL